MDEKNSRFKIATYFNRAEFPKLEWDTNRIQVCSGTIMAVAPVRQKTCAMCYRCPDSCCPGSGELKMVKSMAPLRKRSRLTCAYCQLDLQEELQRRHFEESMDFILLPDSEMEDYMIHMTRVLPRRSLLCTTFDDLINKIHLGEQCIISGTSELQFVGAKCQWIMKVNSVQSKRDTWRDLGNCAWNAILEQIPDYACHFQFGVTFVLAYLFLANITPPGTFFLLKWLLLLLLTETHDPGNSMKQESNEESKNYSKEFRVTSLLVLNPTACPLVSRLVRAAAGYAHPFWEHRPGNQLKTTSCPIEIGVSGGKNPMDGLVAVDDRLLQTSTCSQNKTGSRLGPRNEEQMTYCGTLELAQGGLAFFPSIELLKKKDLATLIYALETIPSDQISSSTADNFRLKQQGKYHNLDFTGISIWATTELNPLKNHYDQNSQTLGTDHSSTQTTAVNSFPLVVGHLPRGSGLKKAICSFDIIVDAELAVGPMETVDSILADMCLSQSLGLEPNEYQSADPDAANSVIYTSVFDACSGIVTAPLPYHVVRLLRVYYLAIRRACTEDRFIVPCSALGTLFKLTKSNARLNGRTNIDEIDALIATYLYDTFVQSLTGTNYLNASAIHYISGVNRESMNELDDILQSIASQLTQLIELGFDQNCA
ncbi:hypothetical protein FBUS_00647 [Fasciolopsis buskii]|uniref:Uncharacterized protein n=1 Tax=Fasciolopsis buskii TaxID=27845 RepID=A0A8E0VH64_9TREM|nr:hypothetical protein FBUS_00647 [Fasciolopsis buski]